MRFTLQDFVEAGLRESPLELRVAGEAVVRAAKTNDWSKLEPEVQAAALVLGKPEQTAPFLLALASSEPVRALELALLSARLTLRFSAPVSKEQVAELGNVVKHEPAEAVLLVQQSAMNAAVAKALATLPVQDLNVENPPLEEVMSELFSRSRAARTAA